MADWLMPGLFGVVCFGLGMLTADWKADICQRVRYCTFCHSDSTELRESFDWICGDCERIFRAERSPSLDTRDND